LLMLIQNIVLILFMVVLVLSVLLLSKQIKIWFYEHRERISIIQLHGGTLLYSSKPILKIIFSSALFSGLFVYLFLYLIVSNISFLVQPELLTIISKNISLEFEIIKILILAFVIPMITFFGLLVQYKLK